VAAHGHVMVEVQNLALAMLDHEEAVQKLEG
jgi:hypothetical protein